MLSEKVLDIVHARLMMMMINQERIGFVHITALASSVADRGPLATFCLHQREYLELLNVVRSDIP